MPFPDLFRALPLEVASAPSRLKHNNFDALRLLFASMVVLFHLGILTQAPSLSWGTYVSATFAVQAFFVVSGFLVTMSYENSTTIAIYALKRIRRIAPAYLFVVVAAAVGLAALSSLRAGDYFASRGWRSYLLFNLLLANFSAPSLPGVFESNFEPFVNGSLWTIKIEVAFYAVVPLMVWAARRFGYQRVLLLIFTGSLAWRLGFEVLGAGPGMDFYARLAKQLPGQMAFFVAGAWAYYRAREGRAPSAWVALIGVLAYALSFDLVNTIIAPLAVGASVIWLALAAPRLPAVGKHGDFSYGVYLYHFPLIQAAIAIGLFRWSPGGAAVLVIVAVALCSSTSWFALEAPMLGGRARHAPASGRRETRATAN